MIAPVKMDRASYCRELETHLCHKNGGHLIRIAGPSFAQVCGWAKRGVPLKVAFRGIDRYVDRYHARGGRRRPVRIEFCEADILEAFDAWCRAVGVSGGVAEKEAEGDDSVVLGVRKKLNLSGHIDRLIKRLTSRGRGFFLHKDLDMSIGLVVEELRSFRGTAPQIRGEKRRQIIDRLSVLDEKLVRSVRDSLDSEQLSAIREEAAIELEPFRMRMPEEAFRRSLEACCNRLLREKFELPQLLPE